MDSSCVKDGIQSSTFSPQHPNVPSTTTTSAPSPPSPLTKPATNAKISMSVPLHTTTRSPIRSTRKRGFMPSSFVTELSRVANHNVKGDEADESDTDIGSKDDDEFFNSDCDDDLSGVGEPSYCSAFSIEGEECDSKQLSTPEQTPEVSNCVYSSLSRVGAKVRRLDLNGDKGLVAQGSINAQKLPTNEFQAVFSKNLDHSHIPLRRSKAVPSSALASAGNNRFLSSGTKSEMEPLIESPHTPNSPTSRCGGSKLLPPSFGSPPSSPTSSGMIVCPPSTTKKGALLHRFLAGDSHTPNYESACFVNPRDDYRLNPRTLGFRNDPSSNSKNDEEEVSPRDAVSFPFFCDSTRDDSNYDCDGSLKENLKGQANNNESFYPSLAGSEGAQSLTIPYSPNRSSITKKTMSRRMQLISSSPPGGLRTHGRANSFLQMFSQESLLEDDPCNSDDDFIRRPNEDDCADGSSCVLKSPTRSINKRRPPSSPVDLSPAPLRSSSFSRFAADFEVVGTLGNGSFGSVYKVRNRMDRRMYAIKAAKRAARGISDRDRMLQEVYALAALSDQTSVEAMHIVRYHQAWMEGNRLYIQIELCQATLMDEIREGVMEEKRRYKLLREMLLALDLVHRSGMIHLDIKPENIFIKNDQYKLGDFGLVSKIENQKDVEEGDSRYMSMELLSGDLDDLTKSDIFSLGATLYEVCLGRGLPENGREWQDIRHGILQSMPNTAFDLQVIIKEMMSPDRLRRPTATELLKKRQLLSEEQRQLIVERNKANAANMALDAQMQRFKLLSPDKKRPGFHRSNTVS